MTTKLLLKTMELQGEDANGNIISIKADNVKIFIKPPSKEHEVPVTPGGTYDLTNSSDEDDAGKKLDVEVESDVEIESDVSVESDGVESVGVKSEDPSEEEEEDSVGSAPPDSEVNRRLEEELELLKEEEAKAKAAAKADEVEDVDEDSDDAISNRLYNPNAGGPDDEDVKAAAKKWGTKVDVGKKTPKKEAGSQAACGSCLCTKQP